MGGPETILEIKNKDLSSCGDQQVYFSQVFQRLLITEKRLTV